ncbi:MAG: hypothetical protein QOE00_3037 [Ilumatobacteraceae bacterium]
MSEVERSERLGITERMVIDALPRAVVVTDANGVITLWNAAAERLYGWTESEVMGRSVVDVLAPLDDRDTNRETLDHVAAGNVLTGDRTVMRRDGEPLRIITFTRPVVDDTGDVVAIVGASEDVSELRLTEQRTRDLTEHFRLALEAGGLGTWRWDMTTGATVWDERLEALFGLPPGGFDGTFETYVSMLHPDDRDDVLAHVREAVEARSFYRVEHKVVWPDGSVRWIAGAGAVTVDEHGVVTGTVGCSMDITERITQEVERQRLVALAIEAADGERVQRERLEFLAAVNDALNESTSVRDVMLSVTRIAVPRLGDWCSIHVLPRRDASIPDVEIGHVDPEMVAFARQLQERFPYNPSAPTGVAHVIRTGKTLFYPDITDEVITELDATEEERDIIAQLALRSSIAVPLTKRGRILGAIQFVMSSSSRRYTEDDVALAQTVAGRIASSLDNQRLNEQQRVIAQTLQRSLLPAALPDIPGIEVAVRYWPAGEATEVGGDFYDVFALEPDKQWALVIGDVCGTGPAAAALTGLARHSIRGSAWHGDTSVEVLSALNRAVLRSATSSFLTATYAVLDASGDRPELTVTCGGHPLPVVATSTGTRTVGKPGTLLGMFEPVSLHPDSTPLGRGDVVVFYTDGATDVRPPNSLTASEFAALVEQAAAAGGTAEVIADRIHEALESILSFNRRDDDIALLVVRAVGE